MEKPLQSIFSIIDDLEAAVDGDDVDMACSCLERCLNIAEPESFDVKGGRSNQLVSAVVRCKPNELSSIQTDQTRKDASELQKMIQNVNYEQVLADMEQLDKVHSSFKEQLQSKHDDLLMA